MMHNQRCFMQERWRFMNHGALAKKFLRMKTFAYNILPDLPLLKGGTLPFGVTSTRLKFRRVTPRNRQLLNYYALDCQRSFADREGSADSAEV